jgi:D-arabinose 1-dehydrogenase-like Zn-dependent alcohol dehydrogenase
MVEFKVIKGSSNGVLVDAVSSREIKSDEVLIDVTHSGVCFTDYVCRCRLFVIHARLLS